LQERALSPEDRDVLDEVETKFRSIIKDCLTTAFVDLKDKLVGETDRLEQAAQVQRAGAIIRSVGQILHYVRDAREATECFLGLLGMYRNRRVEAPDVTLRALGFIGN
jgi:hypothetical protein